MNNVSHKSEQPKLSEKEFLRSILAGIRHCTDRKVQEVATRIEARLRRVKDSK